MDWYVENLRLTIFPEKQSIEASVEWWKNALSIDVDESTRSRQMLTQRAKLNLIENADLVNESLPDRVHWQVILEKGRPPASGGLPTIGEYVDVAPKFADICHSLLSNELCPEMTRIAVGGVLLFPVASKEQGYSVLSEYVHDLRIDSENSFDLSYQINKPRLSKTTNETKINRLMLWSVAKLQQINLDFNRPMIAETAYACRLSFDVNSIEQSDIIPKNNMLNLFEELKSLSEEIMRDGDLP
jgi:hypothetical protein